MFYFIRNFEWQKLKTGKVNIIFPMLIPTSRPILMLIFPNGPGKLQ